MDLNVGRSIQGQLDAYIIQELLSFSDRSKSYACLDSNGEKLRVKLYDGLNTMQGAVRERYNAIPNNIEGVVPRHDSGEVDGCFFDVFEIWQSDISRKVISGDSIKEHLIRPINEGLNALHESGILIRDVDPRHILFAEYGSACGLCSFSNMALLNRHAKATFKRSIGEDSRFVAPEVETMGYSFASDYYALGITLYAITKGMFELEKVSESMWQNWRKTGILPCETNNRIRGENFPTFTQNDRLEYLIMGLTLPDPTDRWGYGEVRAWCHDQEIPLVQIGKKESYDMPIPLTIQGCQCWNYRQLAHSLACNPDIVKIPDIFRRIIRHVSQWNARIGKRLQTAMRESSSSQGTISKWIYILDPTMQNLWWSGKQYSSCEELATEAEVNESALYTLSDILRNDCISSWFNNTDNPTNAATKEMIHSLETEERRHKTVGAYRFIQVFGREQRFRYHGSACRSISELLHNCARGESLDEGQASEILKNQSFRAWIWSNGYDNVQRIVEENGEQKGFSELDIFLLLCERIGNEKDQNVVRRIYLKHGEYAPVFWLQENIDKYSFVGTGEKLKMQFLSGFVTEALSIGQMQTELSEQLRVYLEIIRASKDRGEVIPPDLKYAFTEKWKDIEVAPLFLERVGTARIIGDKGSEWT